MLTHPDFFFSKEPLRNKVFDKTHVSITERAENSFERRFRQKKERRKKVYGYKRKNIGYFWEGLFLLSPPYPLKKHCFGLDSFVIFATFQIKLHHKSNRKSPEFQQWHSKTKTEVRTPRLGLFPIQKRLFRAEFVYFQGRGFSRVALLDAFSEQSLRK